MRRIDSHAHICSDHPDMLQLLDQLDLSCISICVASGGELDTWRTQREAYRTMAEREPSYYRWITTFDLPDFADPDYVDRVIAELDQDFAHGAVAVKAWKNIGMAVKTPDGDFMQIDHPLLTPVFEHLEREGRPVLMHLAEPLACWLPLDPESPHYGYYKSHPQWHMHGRDDHPSHQDIITAWDRMLERHRDLRVIGAHFGSQEYDVEVIAQRMDRFPNYAVDTSARLADIAWQDASRASDFLHRYQDRVLFGVDIGFIEPTDGATDADAARTRFIDRYRSEIEQADAYYGETGPVTVRGRTVPGLGLPETVRDKLYRQNAVRWYQLGCHAMT